MVKQQKKQVIRVLQIRQNVSPWLGKMNHNLFKIVDDVGFICSSIQDVDFYSRT